MRIERITDMAEVLKCLPFEREIRKKRRDESRESHMLLFIKNNLDNPLFGYWIAYDEESNIVGYLVGMMAIIPGQERFLLLRMYAKKKEVREEFEELYKIWMKHFNVRIISMTVRRIKDVRAFERKYSFVPVSVNMERRIF